MRRVTVRGVGMKGMPMRDCVYKRISGSDGFLEIHLFLSLLSGGHKVVFLDNLAGVLPSG